MSLSPSTSAESGVRDLGNPNHATAKRSAAAAGLDDQSQSPSAIVIQNDETAIDTIGEDGAAGKDESSSLVQQQVMAQSQRKYHINDLPDELLVMVLGFVPIDKVFTHMKCSNRWESLCKEAVQTRKSLIIGDDDWIRSAGRMRGWNWRRDRPSEELHNVRVEDDSLVPYMMQSLNQMKTVTRLCISNMNPKNVCPFILKFADRLTMLEVDFAISEFGADVVFPHLKQLRCSIFDAKKASAFPKLTELVIDQMTETQSEDLPDMLLPRLKRLIITGFDDDQIRGFILANAGNLEFLGSPIMPFYPAVVYGQLIELHCRSIHVDMIKAIPAIRHLFIGRTSGEFLKHLPAAQMLSLHITLCIRENDGDDDEEGEGIVDDDVAEEVEPCVAAISRMRHMKELQIAVNSVYSQERPDLSQGLSSMFHELHELERVDIRIFHDEIGDLLIDIGRLNGEEIVCSLVQRNANLRHVTFIDIRLTSTAYASLAQLHHLSHITLVPPTQFIRGKRMITDGILTLLRGSSRRKIRMLKVGEKKLDVDRVTCEVERMAQERSTTFEISEHRFYTEDHKRCALEYKIHA